MEFSAQWPSLAKNWMMSSNNVVAVQVPDELVLADLAARAVEEGIALTIVREPDYGNSITAVALQPGPEARRLCANMPLAGKEKAMVPT